MKLYNYFLARVQLKIGKKIAGLKALGKINVDHMSTKSLLNYVAEVSSAHDIVSQLQRQKKVRYYMILVHWALIIALAQFIKIYSNDPETGSPAMKILSYIVAVLASMWSINRVLHKVALKDMSLPSEKFMNRLKDSQQHAILQQQVILALYIEDEEKFIEAIEDLYILKPSIPSALCADAAAVLKHHYKQEQDRPIIK